MAMLSDTLKNLAPENDAELTEGFERLEEQLSRILTPEQIDRYADHIHQTGAVPVVGALTEEELEEMPTDVRAIARTILGHTSIATEIRRVAALLRQRGEARLVYDR